MKLVAFRSAQVNPEPPDFPRLPSRTRRLAPARATTWFHSRSRARRPADVRQGRRASTRSSSLPHGTTSGAPDDRRANVTTTSGPLRRPAARSGSSSPATDRVGRRRRSWSRSLLAALNFAYAAHIVRGVVRNLRQIWLIQACLTPFRSARRCVATSAVMRTIASLRRIRRPSTGYRSFSSPRLQSVTPSARAGGAWAASLAAVWYIDADHPLLSTGAGDQIASCVVLALLTLGSWIALPHLPAGRRRQPWDPHHVARHGATTVHRTPGRKAAHAESPLDLSRLSYVRTSWIGSTQLVNATASPASRRRGASPRSRGPRRRSSRRRRAKQARYATSST
jgi:hypothetical protein